MRKKQDGRGAATLFCVLGFAGIFAMFSQTGSTDAQMRSANAASRGTNALERLLPAAIGSHTNDARTDRPARLTLR